MLKRIIKFVTDLRANNWKVLYTNGSGEVIELALPADGLPLVGNGVAAAPTFEKISSKGVDASVVLMMRMFR